MKRILSILLSVILAASVFGISASARPLGDVDGDKKTNPIDALTILRYAVGSIDTIDERLADVNCDGSVNSADALIVLRICVGLYDGPTDVDLKPEIIDPIAKSGKFTFSTVLEIEDEEGNPKSFPMTVMVKGNDICACVTINLKDLGFVINLPVDARILILDGKGYIVLPLPGKTYYAKIDKDSGFDIDFDQDFSGIDIGRGQSYAGSRFVTEGKNVYTVDSYRTENGTINEYYFLNGKWAKLVSVNGSQKETKTITDFKSGVEESYFSLKGMEEIDLSQLKK